MWRIINFSSVRVSQVNLRWYRYRPSTRTCFPHRREEHFSCHNLLRIYCRRRILRPGLISWSHRSWGAGFISPSFRQVIFVELVTAWFFPSSGEELCNKHRPLALLSPRYLAPGSDAYIYFCLAFFLALTHLRTQYSNRWLIFNPLDRINSLLSFVVRHWHSTSIISFLESFIHDPNVFKENVCLVPYFKTCHKYINWYIPK